MFLINSSEAVKEADLGPMVFWGTKRQTRGGKKLILSDGQQDRWTHRIALLQTHSALFVHMKWSGNISILVSNSWVPNTSQFSRLVHTHTHTYRERFNGHGTQKRFHHTRAASKHNQKPFWLGIYAGYPQQMAWLALFFHILFLSSLSRIHTHTHTHTQSCSFVTSCVYISVSANENISFRSEIHSTQVCERKRFRLHVVAFWNVSDLRCILRNILA